MEEDDLHHSYRTIQMEEDTVWHHPSIRNISAKADQAIEIFQQKLDQAIEGLPCTARIADFLIWENGDTEQVSLVHDQNFEKFLERAQINGMKMNPKKLKYRQI